MFNPMKKATFIIGLIFVFIQDSIHAQSIGRVGAPVDISTACTGGVVCMGGGSDVDAAFKWMIHQSGGGDFVVIRADFDTAYNSYIYQLGGANSVETFQVASVAAANDSGLVQAVRKAAAVFFSGGDQNDYITYYKGTALGNVFDYLVHVKHAPIGGTSAGMAIMGYVYYDGITDITSAQGLADPYSSGTGIHYDDFLKNPFMQNTITDPHFLTRSRQGRTSSFMARMIKDQGRCDVKAIACDEGTAVCIDQNGVGMVVGESQAFFMRQYCAAPEVCISGSPLTWTNGVKVYALNGPGDLTTAPTVSLSFNISNDWNSGTEVGGVYQYWTVSNGVITLTGTTGTPANCSAGYGCVAGIKEFSEQLSSLTLLSNPVFNNSVSVSLIAEKAQLIQLDVTDIQGRILKQQTESINPGNNSLHVNVQEIPAGMYFLRADNRQVKFVKD
jgi:cyanophycinase-like exopeptidase